MDVNGGPSGLIRSGSPSPGTSSAPRSRKTHAKGGLSDRAHGDFFHTYVLMLLLFRARTADCRYEAAVEYTAAGIFDDIFIRHFCDQDGQDEETYMQLYHNLQSKKIPCSELLPGKKKKETKETGKLNLRRYLKSYIEFIKACDENKAVKRHFVIYTNRILDYEDKTGDFELTKDIFDIFTPKFPDIYFESILKFKTSFSGRDKLLSKLKENTSYTDSEIENFLRDFGFAMAQPMAENVKNVLQTEMLKFYNDEEFKTENVLSRFYKHITHWMGINEGYFKNELDVEGFFTEAEQEIKEHVYSNTSIPTSIFYGRIDELNKLHSAILESNDNFLIKVAVTGPPGVGKTELVLNYIKQHCTSYSNIIWINAETINTLEQSFRDIGILLGILNPKMPDSLSLKILLEKIYTKLNKQKSLVVFDNAVCYESSCGSTGIKEYLPQATVDTKNLNFVLTSQLTKWPCKSCIPIEVFTDEEAVQFLKDNLEYENENDRLMLTNTVGNLPLALQLAIAYIKGQKEAMEICEKDYTIMDFINEYNKNKMSMMKNISECESFSEYKKPISQIWNLALNSVYNMPKNGPLAVKVLCYMSYLEPVQVPVLLLQSVFSEIDQNKFAAILLLLTKFSLLKSSKGQLQIHRLLRDITQLYCGSMQSIITSILPYPKETIILENMLQSFTEHYTKNDNEHLHFNSAFLLHVMKVWDTSCSFKELFQKYCMIGSKILHDLSCTYNYNSGATFIANQQEYFEKYLLLNIIEYYSFVIEHSRYLKEIKELTKALELLKFVISELQQFYPDLKLILGDAFYIQAKVLQSNGSYDEYIEANKKALEIFKEYLGENHRKTLLAMHNVALSEQRLGKLNKALKTFLQVSEMRSKALGNNHFEDLFTKERIACLYAEFGEYPLALATMDEIIKTRTLIYGEMHQFLLVSMHNKAGFLIQYNLYDEGLKLLNKVQEKRCAIYGIDNPYGYGTDGVIAFALHKLGQNEQAYSLIQKVLPLRLKNYKEYHRKTLRDQCTLAMILAARGSIESSINLFIKILHKIKLAKIKEHTMIFTVLFQFGLVLINLRWYSEALNILNILLGAQERKLGCEHPRTKRTRQYVSRISEETKVRV